MVLVLETVKEKLNESLLFVESLSFDYCRK